MMSLFWTLSIALAVLQAGVCPASLSGEYPEFQANRFLHSTSTGKNGMTASDKDELRVVCASIWTQSLADGWDMNEDVGNVVSQAVKSILDCSAAFDLVPRPTGFLPGVGYIVKNAAKIAFFNAALRGNQQYKVCVIVASSNYRSAVEMASLGI